MSGTWRTPEVEAKVTALWMRCHSWTAIAAKTGLTIPQVGAVIRDARKSMREVGDDYKAMRADSLLLIADHLKSECLYRMRADRKKWHPSVGKLLLDSCLFEAKLLGLLAPVGVKVEDATTPKNPAELVARLKHLGMTVPPELKEHDTPEIACAS